MSKNKKQRRILYSWDTSALIAWLKPEKQYLASLDLVASEISSGAAEFVCSSLLRFEISEMHHTPEKIRLVEAFLKRRNVQKIDPNSNVIDLGGKLRDAMILEDKKFRRNDALILATAILYNADVLHSTDPHILRWSGHELVRGLRITVPEPFDGQKPLAYE